MSVGWLLDASVFSEYHDELAAAIVRNGFEVKSINPPDPPYRWDDTGSAYRKAFPVGTCVITHADIELVNRVREEGLWVPGVFATVENFYCSNYFPYFREFLLNRDHVMLPFSQLRNDRQMLFARFGRNGKIFVRPDSPLKIFTGLVVSAETFEKDLEFMAFYEFPRDSVVIVSSPKGIVKEWRFVVAKGQIVAGSLYKDGDTLISVSGYEDGAIKLAEAVLAVGYSPDPVWMLDVCKADDGDYYLLEVGGFSFSNLYACDKDAVVKAASDAAKAICKIRH